MRTINEISLARKICTCLMAINCLVCLFFSLMTVLLCIKVDVNTIANWFKNLIKNNPIYDTFVKYLFSSNYLNAIPLFFYSLVSLIFLCCYIHTIKSNKRFLFLGYLSIVLCLPFGPITGAFFLCNNFISPHNKPTTHRNRISVNTHNIIASSILALLVVLSWLPKDIIQKTNSSFMIALYDLSKQIWILLIVLTSLSIIFTILYMMQTNNGYHHIWLNLAAYIFCPILIISITIFMLETYEDYSDVNKEIKNKEENTIYTVEKGDKLFENNDEKKVTIDKNKQSKPKKQQKPKVPKQPKAEKKSFLKENKPLFTVTQASKKQKVVVKNKPAKIAKPKKQQKPKVPKQPKAEKKSFLKENKPLFTVTQASKKPEVIKAVDKKESYPVLKVINKPKNDYDKKPLFYENNLVSRDVQEEKKFKKTITEDEEDDNNDQPLLLDAPVTKIRKASFNIGQDPEYVKLRHELDNHLISKHEFEVRKALIIERIKKEIFKK